MKIKRLCNAAGCIEVSYDPRCPRHALVPRPRGRRLVALRATEVVGHRCASCREAPATQLDHIVPLHAGGRDVRANRQALCAACHRAKTAAQRAPSGGGGRFGG